VAGAVLLLEQHPPQAAGASTVDLPRRAVHCSVYNGGRPSGLDRRCLDVLCPRVAACRVTGLTLSKEQLAEATARVAAAGLSDKVTLLFCDYRYGVTTGILLTPGACAHLLHALPS
jgi:hypothetical protein